MPVRRPGRAPPPGKDTNARIWLAGVGELLITGRPYEDPIIFGRLRLGEMFEPHVLATLRELAPSDATFLDVGANIGLFTLCMHRLIQSGGQIVAIEPAPENLRLLRRNLRQNGAPTVQVRSFAAASQAGSAELTLSRDNAGDHRLGSRSRGQSVWVRTARLDSLDLQQGGPLVLKLDIQGSETAAVRGMSGLFARHWPVRMLLEFWPYGLEDCGSSADELLHLLSFYFTLFWIVWPHRSPEPATLEDLRRLARGNLSPAYKFSVDIVALHESDAGAIASMEAQASALTPAR